MGVLAEVGLVVALDQAVDDFGDDTPAHRSEVFAVGGDLGLAQSVEPQRGAGVQVQRLEVGQIEETVTLVLQRGRWPLRHRLCYQSKVGASKWLQPSLRTTIRELGTEGVKRVCVVPISFVSDHVETLGEINHEAREEAANLGIERFEMTAGLNDSPTFIKALAELAASAAGIELSTQSGASCLMAAD